MKGKLKLVFIGNSIVNGFPHKRSQGFVSLVREKTGFEVINKGNNGETTSDILHRFEHDAIAHKPNMVFIMTGTNDFIYKEATPERCLENMKSMIEMSRKNNVTPVIMTPVPVEASMASQRWMAGAGVDYNLVKTQLEAFSELLRIYSKTEGVDLLDIYNCFAEYLHVAGSAAAYHDGIHPSAQGQEALADAVMGFLNKE